MAMLGYLANQVNHLLDTLVAIKIFVHFLLAPFY
jgi:hypothetical protein